MSTYIDLQTADGSARQPEGDRKAFGLSMGGWFLVLAVGLFLLQVLPYLSSRWLTDESWYAATGYSIAHGHGIRNPAIGPNDLESRFDARPPGTAAAIAFFFKLFGTEAAVARLGSVLAGLAAVCLTYVLTLDFIGWDGAALAALLMASDNLVVTVSRTARPEAFTLMGILCAALAVKRYAKTGSIRWAFGGGLLIAAAAMFHVTVLGYIVSFGLLLIAMDSREQRLWCHGALAYTAGFILGLAPYVLWILTEPLGRAGFRQEFLSRAGSTGLLKKVVFETNRYKDILGVNMVHAHGLDHVPLRLPIPLCFLAATFLLWKYRRNWFYVELTLLIPSVLWFIYTVNKSSRYTALLSPIFAVTIAASVTLLRRNRGVYRAGLAVTTVIVVAQVAANALLLRAASHADYTQVEKSLRNIIPAGATAYGTVTFWLAFHDQPFISYERTDPWVAAASYNTHYFITGDPMMRKGEPGGDGFYERLNAEMIELQQKSTIVGKVDDPYYGQLVVYRLDR